MCEWGTDEPVVVKIPADLSHTGVARWKRVSIDACIAGLVHALQTGGVNMRGSCCGHGSWYDLGSIALQDGRMLIIADADQYYHEWRWVMRMIWRAVALQLRGWRYRLEAVVQQ